MAARTALLLVALAASLSASAQPWSDRRPDAAAPAGVLDGHAPTGQQVAVTVRAGWLSMDGNLAGAAAVPDAEALSPSGFRAVPTRTTAWATFFGVTVAPSRRLAVALEAPLQWKAMDYRTRESVAADPDAVAYTTRSEGLGDLSLTARVLVAEGARHRLHAGFGVSLPWGLLEENDNTPERPSALLPYAMQMGSGTVDLLPSVTYLGRGGRVGWGAQARGALRLGTNGRQYALGDRAEATAWGSVVVTGAVSLSARVAGQAWGDVEGGDPNFATRVRLRLDPSVLPDLRAGERVEASVGLNAYVPGGAYGGLRAGVEVGVPVYQRLDGPQLGVEAAVTVGLQYDFRL